MMLLDAIKSRFNSLLSVNEPPHRTALAFAVGIFIAFSPTIGFHTISAVAVAWMFKLNLAVLIAGTLINNPGTIVFVYGGSICFGGFILQNENPCYIENLRTEELMTYPKEILMPYLTGTIVLGIIVAVISYFILYKILVRHRRHKNTEITTPSFK